MIAGAEPCRYQKIFSSRLESGCRTRGFTTVGDRWQARFDNILKPFAVPAVMGVILTLLGFGILLGGLTAPRHLMAEDGQGVFDRRDL